MNSGPTCLLPKWAAARPFVCVCGGVGFNIDINNEQETSWLQPEVGFVPKRAVKPL